MAANSPLAIQKILCCLFEQVEIKDIQDLKGFAVYPHIVTPAEAFVLFNKPNELRLYLQICETQLTSTSQEAFSNSLTLSLEKQDYQMVEIILKLYDQCFDMSKLWDLVRNHYIEITGVPSNLIAKLWEGAMISRDLPDTFRAKELPYWQFKDTEGFVSDDFFN